MAIDKFRIHLISGNGERCNQRGADVQRTGHNF
jgi:hypothetical protein